MCTRTHDVYLYFMKSTGAEGTAIAVGVRGHTERVAGYKKFTIRNSLGLYVTYKYVYTIFYFFRSKRVQKARLSLWVCEGTLNALQVKINSGLTLTSG